MPTYDLFISYRRLDAQRVRPLVDGLRGLGIAVWIDESEIEDFAAVTLAIKEGIAQSKAVLVWYSAIYPLSRPCQWELTAAYLAAQQAGDPRQRVLIVNPETSPDHIALPELKDQQYLSAPVIEDQAGYHKLATRIAIQVQGLTGILGDIRPLATPSWYPNAPAGSVRFVGRLRHMWQVHEVLWRGQTVIGQLKQGTALAQLVGGGGMGKSLLAEEYALRYGTAYPGGVFWLSASTAAGSGASASIGALAQKREQHWRNVAAWLGMEIKDKTLVQIEGELHVYFAHKNQPFLWMIDDVPADIPMQDLRGWYAPHSLGKTLLTTRSHEYAALGGKVEVGVLAEAEAEARSLLTQQRPPANDNEATAVADILTALGRHALACSGAASKANAMRVSAGQFGNRATFLRNAEPAVPHQHDAARQCVEQHFSSPQVVMFTGHMLDAPERPQPRFPASTERIIYKRILHTLRQWETKIGFSSASGGADILFLEALKELGAETNIVLPHPPELFIETSVACVAGGDWVARFKRVLADARQVTELSASVGDQVTYHFNGIVMAGLATLRCSQLHGNLRGLTVWDLDAGYVGGTGSTVSEWLRRGISVERFSPRADEPVAVTLQAVQGFGAAEDLLRAGRQKIICMLFADAVGFSKLSESQIPIFVEQFLGGVRQVMDRQARAPLTCNTWGDGLYFTFDSVLQANDFALDLGDFVNAIDWPQCGLPAEMSLRIALHAGPAFEILDPVTQQRSFTGSHVSRTARIEPVTPPGYVYCSESHAALVALEKNAAYHCEFVGNLSFAKNFGVFPTYSLKRRTASES